MPRFVSIFLTLESRMVSYYEKNDQDGVLYVADKIFVMNFSELCYNQE